MRREIFDSPTIQEEVQGMKKIYQEIRPKLAKVQENAAKKFPQISLKILDNKIPEILVAHEILQIQRKVRETLIEISKVRHKISAHLETLQPPHRPTTTDHEEISKTLRELSRILRANPEELQATSDDPKVPNFPTHREDKPKTLRKFASASQFE